jgi:hypothetical protein
VEAIPGESQRDWAENGKDNVAKWAGKGEEGIAFQLELVMAKRRAHNMVAVSDLSGRERGREKPITTGDAGRVVYGAVAATDEYLATWGRGETVSPPKG